MGAEDSPDGGVWAKREVNTRPLLPAGCAPGLGRGQEHSDMSRHRNMAFLRQVEVCGGDVAAEVHTVTGTSRQPFSGGNRVRPLGHVALLLSSQQAKAGHVTAAGQPSRSLKQPQASSLC